MLPLVSSVVGAPVLGAPVLGAPVLGSPVVSSPVVGALAVLVVGAPVLGAPVSVAVPPFVGPPVSDVGSLVPWMTSTQPVNSVRQISARINAFSRENARGTMTFLKELGRTTGVISQGGGGHMERMEGDRIRRIRHLLGLSQTRMATILGCDVSTWCRYEKGHTNPSPYTQDLIKVFERASADPSIMRELRDLQDTETPAVLWFILDRVYRSRLR